MDVAEIHDLLYSMKLTEEETPVERVGEEEL